MAIQKIENILELIASNRNIEAISLCEEILNLNPNNVEVLQLQATCYLKLGKYSDAFNTLILALKLEPHNVVLHNNLGNLYKMQGNLELALRHLNEALYLNPDYAQTHHNLGNLYYKTGQIEQALNCYQKCLRLSPNFYEAHFNLANCYVKQEQIFKAIEHYLIFLEHNPEHYQACINLGMLYISIQDFTNALPWLLKALAIHDLTPEVHGHLADCYLELGNNLKALEHYEIVNAKVSDPGWLHNLAVLYLRNENQSQALEYFKKTLALNSHNPTAEHMIYALENQPLDRINPKYTAALFDQYAYYYNQHMKSQLAYDLPTQFRHLIQESTLKNILDLGCGTGLCGIVFRDQAKTLVGVDLSQAMLQMALMLGAYDCLVQANINDVLPGFKQNYFEIILAAEVLGYLGDLEQIFTNIAHTLKAGGKFIFSIEINHSLQASDKFRLQSSGRFCHNPGYIDELAAQYNFTIVHTEKVILRKSATGNIDGQIFILANSPIFEDISINL